MSRVLTVVMMIVVLSFGIFLGTRLNTGHEQAPGSLKKMYEAYGLIRELYVDEVQGDSLVNSSIKGMVDYLDPHSVYLEPEKVVYSQAELEGNFDGIGIEFDIISDTLLVVSPLSGGPSAAVGVAAGDRILAIDSVSAIGITHQDVLRKLRGTRGSLVYLRVFRPFNGKYLDFKITRGRITTSSVDAAFVLPNGTGYIRLSRFAETTADEFRAALARLKKQGMKKLLVDLRGNPGGILDQAVSVADEFLPKGKMIVYTKSVKNSIEDAQYLATSNGGYETGEVILLVDRGSASASEILAGALQDNRRALVLGELTFGKGLVQRQYPFKDGSALRLTVSRYYTPSGRQIQRHYKKGVDGRESYYNEAATSLTPQKLFADNDSLLYLKNGDISVYRTGGFSAILSVPAQKSGDSRSVAALRNAGGVVPDYWVTGKPYSDFYQELYRTGSFDDLAQRVLDNPASSVQQYRKSMERFLSEYSQDSRLESLVRKTCEAKKIRFDQSGFLFDRSNIALAIKARIAHQLFGAEAQIRVYVVQSDPLVKFSSQVPVTLVR
ncbi:S41 family peptidase [Chlorobium phaeobacteroides]|uniref:C-terminal processing peptidase-3, Serine peptidase, MEROPS family S41A n=1 Tax=Chlorobium phaeobacteroides (strain DSM 266 / SMG 266 / 2430) TaxID=290317 RepID=A1BGM4_CHLPD|nr:S41 family peptidase [Chlorobium phaeobacteroides]ABL65551.1 C-terminal processing peptidase-3, Serine peptidase, MEROPS family S41A [Chlorobium phaeobacteroides DSM 266]MBV5326667.1 S41 family peptidase [Chlorobium sp.]